MKGLHGEKIDTALVSVAWIGVESDDRKSSFESRKRPEREERCRVERKRQRRSLKSGMLWRKQETEGTREDGRKELSNEK